MRKSLNFNIEEKDYLLRYAKQILIMLKEFKENSIYVDFFGS